MSLWEKIKTHHLIKSVVCWFDDDAEKDQTAELDSEKIDWLRVIPFLLLHLACLTVI